jgi:hypothetical protein
MDYYSLPEDYQCILFQLIEELGTEPNERLISLALLGYQPKRICIKQFALELENQKSNLGDKFWDYRGQPHVNELAEVYRSSHEALPPIITVNGKWVDGRHRMLAAHSIGVSKLPCIELLDIIKLLD